MASPVGHIAVGCLVWRWMRGRFPGRWFSGRWLAPMLLLAAIGMSLLPDGDAAIGIATGDFGRWHNNFTHSLPFGLAIGVLAGLAMRLFVGGAARAAILFTVICYELHIALDYFTQGRGVMLFWPLTDERFHSPVLLFYGVQWSKGFWTAHHLITLANELALILLGYLVWSRLRRRRSPAPVSTEAGT